MLIFGLKDAEASCYNCLKRKVRRKINRKQIKPKKRLFVGVELKNYQ